MNMSRVHAVTEDISFVVKTASFTPLPTEKLITEFSKWIQQQAKENNFIVWRCSLEGSAQDYNA
jgi:hypothetical protein